MTLKDHIEEPSFNPFGEKEYTYTPDMDSSNYHVSGKRGKVNWVRIILIFSVSIIVLTLVMNSLLVYQQKRNALHAMEEFNTSMSPIRDMFTDDNTSDTFRKASEDKKLSPDSREAAKILSTFVHEIKGLEYHPLREDMTNDEALDAVLPYYAACDAVSIMQSDMDMGKYGKQCADFSQSAVKMMEEIQGFNSLNNSLPGMIDVARHKNLPDVTVE